MKIVHIICNLGTGGAETLLKNTINLFPEYEHFIIYLNEPDDLLKQIKYVSKAVCLHHSSWRQFFSSRKKIKKLLTEWEPDIVHAHLFDATLLTRLAIPSGFPLLSTIHSTYSVDAFSINKKALWAERLTVHKQKAIIGVSKFVLDDYLMYVPFKGQTFVLHNFLPTINELSKAKRVQNNGVLRCVSVGNLKDAKNYSYLIKVFSYLKEEQVTLDIYGDGPLRSRLQQEITDSGGQVHLCGTTQHIQEKMLHYDLFIQASTHEGFGISVAESMAMRLPVFLSDIPVFKEVTGGNAFFFPLSDAKAAANNLKLLKNKQEMLNHVAEAAYQLIQHTASEELYKEKLKEIYFSLLLNKAIN